MGANSAPTNNLVLNPPSLRDTPLYITFQNPKPLHGTPPVFAINAITTPIDFCAQ